MSASNVYIALKNFYRIHTQHHKHHDVWVVRWSSPNTTTDVRWQLCCGFEFSYPEHGEVEHYDGHETQHVDPELLAAVALPLGQVELLGSLRDGGRGRGQGCYHVICHILCLKLRMRSHHSHILEIISSLRALAQHKILI